MVIVHLAATKKRDEAAFLWAEIEEKGRPPGRRKSRWEWLAGGREHPYQAGRDLLAAALPELTLQMGHWLWLTAWLPSDAAGPLPSEDGIAPLAGRKAEQLAPSGVRVLGAAAGCLHDLLLARRQAGAAWRLGAEGAFLERVHELAGSLVVRQQFLPAFKKEGTGSRSGIRLTRMRISGGSSNWARRCRFVYGHCTGTPTDHPKTRRTGL